MTRVGLEEMEFYAFHGYYEAERKMGNKYLLDVFVELKTELKSSEDIHDTVNYEIIYDISKKEMEAPKLLLESVVHAIAAELKARFAIIETVDIRLRKIGVQVGGKVKQSVIEYKL